MKVVKLFGAVVVAVILGGCQTPPKMSQVDEDAPEQVINSPETVQALKARQK